MRMRFRPVPFLGTLVLLSLSACQLGHPNNALTANPALFTQLRLP